MGVHGMMGFVGFGFVFVDIVFALNLELPRRWRRR